LLTRIRARTGLARTRIGAAVVVHADDDATAEARVLAESLPADSEHELVVADLPPASTIEVWKSFAAALPRGRRPVRIVPGRQPREVAPHVWQWLADLTGRAVLAPYGRTHQAAGSLFVHSMDQSGWVSFGRGRAPAWKGKRFPQPAWDSVEVGRVRSAGLRGVAEPLPAGMWLRPDVGDGVLATGRARLTSTLPCLPDAPTIVLGARDAADLEVADIAAFWRTLPPNIAATARFARYGGVVLPDDVPFGQALADALDTEVCCYTGIPTGPPDALDVLTLRQDGSLGWSTFAQALAYRPRGAGATRLGAHRTPVSGLGEVAPGVYWYTTDIMLEIVQAGLWIRPAEQIADPAGVRTAPPDPAHNLLLYEATEPNKADRLREVAESLVNRLDDATRLVTRLLPSTALSENAPATVPRPVGRPADAVSPSAEPTPPPQPREPEDEPAETDLPWLSRLMETMSMPVPARLSEVERHHDRGSR
jgi:hypothetical protein